ncbi:serine hydrolase domain-containing protein [Sphingomicrobium arenosum]|uniref:serine hydrolase domain-containing protein n=1 Tax=Sphingomicrobium arenosum TaxID=2233861 RepID=UPI002240F41A|nr:serine hydrolase [Sphingomicrobium arenosum]
MKALLPLLSIALAGCVVATPEPQPELAEVAATDAVAAVLERYQFDGEVAVSYGGARPDYRYAASGAEQRWPWASVTKQVVATIVMQEVAKGRLDLDAPVSTYLADWPESPLVAPSLRQLLQHQSGLYDPEDDPAFDWKEALPLDPMMCVARRSVAPGGAFDYTNCDTLLVARVLERTTDDDIEALWQSRIAQPVGLEQSGFATPRTRLGPSVNGTLAAQIAHYGAAGGLAGTASDLLAFDHALMDGRLLPEAARAEMWTGNPAIGYAALGQWAFEAPLAGCDGPVRIIERRGAIGGYQARNFILPDRDVAMVAFIGRGEGDYAFGEIWMGEGLSFEMLSAAACAS